MIFETHAHYEDVRFDEDREEILGNLGNNGIEKVVNVGSTFETSKTSIVLAEKYSHVYAAIGVHPSEIDCLNESVYEWLQANASHPKVVSIGEIGLDYYWEKEQDKRDKQKEAFIRQMEIAGEVKLPIIVHSRDAAADTLELMKTHNAHEIPGVIHCYGYSVEMAREFVKMGYYIGIGGVVTFKNARVLKEVATEIPLEHLVVETDCPYMAPEPHRGKRNSSLYLPYVVEQIAELKGVTAEEVMKVTRENGYKLFSKIKEKGEKVWQH